MPTRGMTAAPCRVRRADRSRRPEGIRSAWLALPWLFALLVITGSSVRAATPQQIDEAIRKGVANLYSQQRPQGNWEAEQNFSADAFPYHSQWGGPTALTTYALLASGENPTDPRIVKAVDWLRTAPIVGHYALGVRANVWLHLPKTEANMTAMKRDAKLIANGVIRDGAARGLYAYTPIAKSDEVDISCSQFGVLGAWAAAQRLESMPPGYWQTVEKAWRAQQNANGSYAYHGKPQADAPENIQMTAAGVATLFITQEFVHADEGIEGNKGNIVDAHIDKGMDWITKNLPALMKMPSLYALYGIERVGLASGYKYFGDIDWFEQGADAIVRTQRPDGSWDGSWGAGNETSLAILFLSRGRAPVMMNKLQYNITAPDGKTKEANWNQRPRDVAYATRFVGEATERSLNWQILNLGVATIADLHDSGILYISGNQSLHFTAREKAMLRQYIDEGGLIVANADVGKPEFSKAVRDMAREFYPTYEFQTLSQKSDHVLMNGQQFKASTWKKLPKIDVLSNGSRLLFVLIPSDDFARAWQKRDATKPEAAQFIANLFMYTSDKSKSQYKGQSHIVRADPKITPATKIQVARLKYAGNWDPEPGGWKRLAAVLHNQDNVELQTRVVELATQPLDGFKVAHLTGTTKFAFTDAEAKALQAFVKAGGLLVIDACGGASEFDVAMNAELAKVFPAEAVQLATPLKPTSKLFTEAAGNASVPLQPKYRTYAMLKLGPDAASFRLKGIESEGKLRILYSSEDLSTGLVGVPTDGILGYDPATATELLRRLLLLKTQDKL